MFRIVQVQFVFFAISFQSILGALPKSEHLIYGTPGYIPNNPKTKLIIRPGYALLHDNIRKGPLWVSYRLTTNYLVSQVGRAKDAAFKPDPLLSKGSRAEVSDYRHSGWDRGHMAPSADMRRSESIQKDCFYLSNMIPQNHPLNSGLWSKLEELGRTYTLKYGDMIIVTGPIYFKNLLDGSRYKSIGKNKVAIPTWIYKIFIRKSKDQKIKTLAFELPNMALNIKTDLAQYLTSIKNIELGTKFKFLNSLPLKTQNMLKNTQSKKLWSITPKK